jgi:hypothetical protein
MSDTVYTTPAPDGRIAVIAHDEETGHCVAGFAETGGGPITEYITDSKPRISSLDDVVELFREYWRSRPINLPYRKLPARPQASDAFGRLFHVWADVVYWIPNDPERLAASGVVEYSAYDGLLYRPWRTSAFPR